MIEYIKKNDVLEILTRHHINAMLEIWNLTPSFTVDSLKVTEEKTEDDTKENKASEKPSKINVGGNIRAIRKEKGITQAELAEMANCGTQSNIWQIERRTGSVNISTLIKIAEALGVSVADLVKENEL